jgi:hypothetical protein
VQLKPGNTYPLGAATATTLVIDGGAGASFPVLDVLVDFPLDSIPSGADVRSVKLKLDAMTTGSSSLTVQALGYNGDGQAALQDENVATTLIGSKTGPFTAAGDVTIDLDPSFIESLLSGDATHLGLRLKSATTGPFIDIAATEHATAAPPTLVVEFTSTAAGDFDFDADVDGSDFLTWQRGVGSVYEAAHLVEWTSHFGGGPEMVGAGSTTMATPEPSSALLAIGFTALASTARPGGRWRRGWNRRYNRSHGC